MIYEVKNPGNMSEQEILAQAQQLRQNLSPGDSNIRLALASMLNGSDGGGGMPGGQPQTQSTMPTIGAGSVVGLGLQGTQNLQGMQQQSLQDQAIQAERQRQQREQALQAEKDRAHDLKVEMERFKNDQTAADLQVERAKALGKFNTDENIRQDEATGATRSRELQNQAMEQKLGLDKKFSETLIELDMKAAKGNIKAQQLANQMREYQMELDKEYGEQERQQGLATKYQFQNTGDGGMVAIDAANPGNKIQVLAPGTLKQESNIQVAFDGEGKPYVIDKNTNMTTALPLPKDFTPRETGDWLQKWIEDAEAEAAVTKKPVEASGLVKAWNRLFGGGQNGTQTASPNPAGTGYTPSQPYSGAPTPTTPKRRVPGPEIGYAEGEYEEVSPGNYKRVK